MPFITSRTDLNSLLDSSREVYADKAPAGTTPPADGWPVGSDTWPLSLSTVIMRALR